LAPYTAKYSLFFSGIEIDDIKLLTIDFDGDGKTDVSTADPSTVFTFTFSRPGVYRSRLTAFDVKGRRYFAERMVRVLDRTDPTLLQTLVSVIDGAKSALRAGNTQALGAFVTAEGLANLGSSITDSPARLATVSAVLEGEAKLIDLGDFRACVGIVRSTPAGNALHRVILARAGSGEWKIESL
jgi:hypothetical protein